VGLGEAEQFLLAVPAAGHDGTDIDVVTDLRPAEEGVDLVGDRVISECGEDRVHGCGEVFLGAGRGEDIDIGGRAVQEAVRLDGVPSGQRGAVRLGGGQRDTGKARVERVGQALSARRPQDPVAQRGRRGARDRQSKQPSRGPAWSGCLYVGLSRRPVRSCRTYWPEITLSPAASLIAAATSPGVYGPRPAG
jgi:hypothetical protein